MSSRGWMTLCSGLSYRKVARVSNKLGISEICAFDRVKRGGKFIIFPKKKGKW